MNFIEFMEWNSAAARGAAAHNPANQQRRPQPSTIQLFSSFLPRAAGEQKEERVDGLAAQRWALLGAPLHSNQPIRSIHQLH